MIDQGLENTSTDGQKFFACGGDFGDIPNDENFCMNGDFASDRTPITLRANSRLFLLVLPILYAPYFAFVTQEYQ